MISSKFVISNISILLKVFIIKNIGFIVPRDVNTKAHMEPINILVQGIQTSTKEKLPSKEIKTLVYNAFKRSQGKKT